MIGSHLVVATALALFAGGAALAQEGGDSAPAELPPEGFEAAQYVDSLGCAYLRAGISGEVRWVPRRGPDRQPLCGFPPTIAVVAGAAAPEPAEEAVPIPARPEARPPRTGRDPIPTVAAIATPPRIVRPAAAAPAPVRAAAPQAPAAIRRVAPAGSPALVAAPVIRAVPAATVTAAPRPSGWQTAAPVPRSNPVIGLIPPAPPPGWERVWEDGRINLHRGLPARLTAPSAAVIAAPGSAVASAPAARVVAPVPGAGPATATVVTAPGAVVSGVPDALVVVPAR